MTSIATTSGFYFPHEYAIAAFAQLDDTETNSPTMSNKMRTYRSVKTMHSFLITGVETTHTYSALTYIGFRACSDFIVRKMNK